MQILFLCSASKKPDVLLFLPVESDTTIYSTQTGGAYVYIFPGNTWVAC